MKTGFIGLGIMGSRMAANLQKSGHELVIHNRSREKAKFLEENGASWADTPAAVSRQVDILFTMLAAPESVTATALGPEGFLDQLKPGSLWVDCSTVNPSFSQEMAEEAQQRKIRFVNAPVMGSKAPAETGDLLFLVGGDEDDVKECQPFFEVMGRNMIHVGGQGMGSAMKMVFNMLLATSMLAFTEAMSLGQSLGIAQEQLFNALLNSPIVPPFLKGKKEKIQKEDFDPDFPLKLMQKDLHLAAVTAYENEVALPLVNAVKEVYALAVQQDLGDQDFSAIYQFINR